MENFSSRFGHVLKWIPKDNIVIVSSNNFTRGIISNFIESLAKRMADHEICSPFAMAKLQFLFKSLIETAATICALKLILTISQARERAREIGGCSIRQKVSMDQHSHSYTSRSLSDEQA